MVVARDVSSRKQMEEMNGNGTAEMGYLIF